MMFKGGFFSRPPAIPNLLNGSVKHTKGATQQTKKKALKPPQGYLKDLEGNFGRRVKGFSLGKFLISKIIDFFGKKRFN